MGNNIAMKTHPQDDALRSLLRESHPAVADPNPRFRTAVWERIEAARRQPRSWFAWAHIHLFGVGTAVAASLLVSAAGGGWIAKVQVAHEREQLVERYLASIDPHAHAGTTVPDNSR